MDYFLEEFLEKYPNIVPFEDVVLNPYDTDFYNSIYRKKEFYEKRLYKFEPKPTKAGDTLKHQDIIARFLSTNTLYDSLLVVHEMGTGKTGVSIAVAELLKRQYENNRHNNINKALVLLKGKTMIDNFIQELVFTNTPGQYIPENYDNLTEQEKIRRINKLIGKFYNFDTFEVFAKKINDMNDSKIIQEYSNRLIIIDEAHNITESVYTAFHRMLHLAQNCKILIMTATPMKDKPEEIALLLNLILPANRQLPTGENFIREYLIKLKENRYQVNSSKRDLLKTYFKGRLSFLKPQTSDVIRSYQGTKLGDLDKFLVNSQYMSSFQSQSYLEAFSKDTKTDDVDKKGKGIYSNSIQASLFVYPDGSYGSTGFEKYIQKKEINTLDGRSYSSYNLSSELKKELLGKTDEETISKIRKFSSKYADVLTQVTTNPKESTFIYGDLVEGSGIILLSKLFELLNFERSKGNDKNPKKRYAILSNKTSSPKEISNIIKSFNKKENKNGEYIRVIIGSRVVSEGVSLKNIQQIHILTPHWNYSETDQAIARGLRLFSHKDLEDEKKGEEIIVKIFQHVSIPSNKKLDKTIDYIMYLLSEDKDFSIKNIERVLREVSFDCALNFLRNYKPGNDYQRLCEYMKCEYKCDVQNPEQLLDEQLDQITYNLFYSKDILDGLINKINNLFKIKSFYFLKELKDELKINDFLLLSCLDFIISNNIPLIDNTFSEKYLKNYKNIFYLENNFEDSFQKNSSMMSWDYNQSPYNFRRVDLSEVVKNYEIDNISSTLEKLQQITDYNDYEKIFKKLSLDIQESFIEVAIIYDIKKMKDDNSRLFDWILNYHKDYIKKLDEEIIISRFLGNDKARCSNIKTISQNSWRNCNTDEIKKLKILLQITQKSLEQNPYGYYGIIDKKTNKFKIRNVSELEKVESIDKRKRTTGRECKILTKTDILYIVHKIKLDYDEKTFSAMNKEGVINLLSGKKTANIYSDVSVAFSKEQLESFSEDEVKRIFYWSGKKNKNEICDAIRQWFISKNMVDLI